MYKNIVFDIGNVILEFKPMEYLKTKIKDKDIIPKIYEDIFRSDEWVMLDRGVISEEEAREKIINRNRKNENEIRLAFDGWYDLLKPMTESIEIIKKLKIQGYKVYYLSNFHHYAFNEVTNKNEFFNIFDGGVVSFKEKLLKPEKEIYIKLLERYNLEPKETIFIDDTLENIRGSEVVDIKGILFENPEKLIKEFEKLDIKL